MIQSSKSLEKANHYVTQLRKTCIKPSDSRTEEGLKDVYERLRPGEPKLLTALVAY